MENTAAVEPGQLTLGELISALKAEDPDRMLPLGFGNPHSYRGHYEQLAFEPMADRTIGDMLASAESALGATYVGYKGGDFVMSEYTNVWLAEYGRCGESLGRMFLALLLEKGSTRNER